MRTARGLHQARDEFTRAIALLDDPTDALAERAGISFVLQDYEAAEKDISAAIDRRPQVPEYLETREFYRRFLRVHQRAAGR